MRKKLKTIGMGILAAVMMASAANASNWVWSHVDAEQSFSTKTDENFTQKLWLKDEPYTSMPEEARSGFEFSVIDTDTDAEAQETMLSLGNWHAVPFDKRRMPTGLSISKDGTLSGVVPEKTSDDKPFLALVQAEEICCNARFILPVLINIQATVNETPDNPGDGAGKSKSEKFVFRYPTFKNANIQ